jgi:hypothetical protein
MDARTEAEYDLSVDVLGDRALDSGDQRLLVVRAALSPHSSSPDPPSQGVGAVLYSGATGQVGDAFQLATGPVGETPPPVAAATWRSIGGEPILIYATTPDVAKVQVYIGHQTAQVDPGIGVVDGAGVDASGAAPPTAVIGFTSDGTVVPGSPVIAG